MKKITLAFFVIAVSVFFGQTQSSTLGNGQVGPAVKQDGTIGPVRTGRSGENVNTEAHGRYQEPVYRGQVYTATSQAAVSLGAGLTATSVWTLYNPIQSKVNLVLLRCTFTLSAIPAAQSTILLAIPGTSGQAAPTAVTQLATSWPNNLIGTTYASSAARVYTAATLAATPIALEPLGTFLFTTSSTTTQFVNMQFGGDLAGIYIIPPGSAITLQATTAASGFVSMTWEEIPL